MTQFFKKFLADDGSRLALENGRFFSLGAFGKHPGWDDHIEDLGLDTETLATAKLLLYVKGVGGQIDTGSWEKLSAADRLESFDHTFLWLRGPQLLLGRLWSSTDGKGRSRYPMVICAQCIGASASWTMENILPRLKEVEQECKATVNAAEVRAILDRARSALRGRLVHAGPEAQGGAPGGDVLERFVADPVFGPGQQGWFRLLYHVQNQMAAFAAGHFSSKGDLSGLRSQPLRVPVGSSSPEQALKLWARFFEGRFDRAVPILLIVSAATEWLDVIVGEPSSHDFFGLRARPKALPLITEVPYEINEAFMTAARRGLSEFQQGKGDFTLAGAEASPQPGSSEPGGWISVTQRWFKGKTGKLWLFLLVLALGGAAGAVLLSQRGKSSSDIGSLKLTAAKSVEPVPTKPASSGQLVKVPPQAPIPAPAPSPAAPPPLAQPVPPPARQEPAVVSTSPPASASISTASAAPMPAVQAAPPGPTAISVPVVASKPAAPDAPVNAESKPTNLTAVVLAAAQLTPSEAKANSSAASDSSLNKTLTNNIGMVLIWVPGLPGTTDGGYVGKYEVTQREFERVQGSNPSRFKNPLQPVESVTWDEARDFCRKLTSMDKDAGTLPSGFVYALPTQAQWEFFLGDANFEDAVTSRVSLHDTPATVGSLRPNNYGLYDVLGNVWEYCADSGAAEKLLKGAAYNNRKLSADWKPLERTTARRLAGDMRMPDAGLRCVAFRQP